MGVGRKKSRTTFLTADGGIFLLRELEEGEGLSSLGHVGLDILGNTSMP